MFSTLLLKKFTSGSKELSVKISAVLSKGSNFKDSKFKTSVRLFLLILSLPTNVV